MSQTSASTALKMPSFGGGRPGGGPARFAPGAKPQNTKGTLLRVVRIYAHFGATIGLVIALTAVSALVSVAIPYVVGRAFDTFHVNPVRLDSARLLRLLAIVAGLYAVNYVLGTVSGLVTLNVTQRLVNRLRPDFFVKLQKLPLAFFDTRPHGDTMSRLTNDVDNISSTIASTTTQLVASLLTLLGSLVVMLVLSPVLTIAVVVSVVAAARLARADGFIEKLPQGYRTMVSGSTDNLSEGQRQLLAIARAVLSDSPILILDEATSSVDTKTEKDIQRALLALMSNHTSFLIAHRLSTIRDADRIMVIGDGEILESGNHQQLMARKGRYYAMVVSQLGVAEARTDYETR